MLKKILSLFIFLSGTLTFAQNVPTLLSYEADTLCEFSYEDLIATVTIQDLDGDSTYLDLFNSGTGLLNDQIGYVVVGLAYTQGATTRDFEIYGTTSSGIPAGFNTEQLNFDIIGNANNDGGAGFGTVDNIGIYGDLGVSVDFGTTTFCTSDNPVDLTPYTTHPGGYTVHGTSQDIIMEGGFSPYEFYYDSGDGLEYYWTNDHGCTEVIFAPWPTIFESPTVAISPTQSTCGNADGAADAFITGQYAPFDAFWTNGQEDLAVSSISTANNLSSGTYYVTVTDQNGCTAQAPAQISDADLIVTENITDQTCPGSGNGAIDLTISGGTVDQIWWSNGQLTEDISGLNGGDYTVSIHTTGNCQAFYTYNVGSPAPLQVSVDNIVNENCLLGQFNSAIYITTTGGSGSYSWDWDSGTFSAEDWDTDPGVGNHVCVVTDAVTGCTYEWDVNVSDNGAPYVFIDNVVKPHCNQNDGAIDAYVGVNNAPISSIIWSSGQTTEDINGIGPGTYTVTATDQNGCWTSETVTVPNAKPYQPTICLLTVDTSFTYNQVIWEKDPSQNIDGFNVYRETQTQGVFELVAQRPYALESYYMDNIASPMDRSWRYRITTYDACGGESFPSFIHKTIHCVAVPGQGSDMEVYWDEYEGINYTSVDLFRYDDTNGWTNIGNFGPGVQHHTDTPPVLSGLDYIVSFNLTDICTTTKAQDYNSSRSNNINAAHNPGGSSLNIDDAEIGEISIYPNPTNSTLNIFVENPELFEFIEVRDINGHLVFNDVLSSGYTTMDFTNLADGIYFIRLVSEQNIINHKVIKE